MQVEHAAEINHVEHIQAQIAKIVMHRLGQFFTRESRVHDPSSPRRALILVTMTRSLG